MERQAKLLEIDRLQVRVRQLEAEVAAEESHVDDGHQHNWAYFATTGFLLGIFGAGASLLLNVVGSLAWPYLRGAPSQNPLRLIQVYLTFPMGQAALETDSGIALAIGSCLYIATGMVYGIIFQVMFSRYFPRSGLAGRLAVASLLAIAIWLINFYGILSWLQPLLFGGRWILDLVDWWVACLTHLVFGWTMALVYPLGVYQTCRISPESR